MNNWRTVRLGDIAKDGRGYYGIGASAVPFSPEKYTYLRITDINDDGTLNKADLKSVDAENAENYLLSPNDVVFARTGNSTGRNYFYDGKDGKFVYAGFLIKFSIDNEKINPKYVKYFLRTKEYWDWISSFNTGSTRGNINAQTYANLEIPLLSPKQQNLIAEVLGALDDKIECNNRINRNLEEQAAVLFRRWFVDFEFPDPDPTSPTYGKPYRSAGGKMQDSPLGLIPLGWQVSTLGDYCKVKSGFAFKSAWWQNNGIKVLKIKNIDSNNTLNLSDCSFVSEDKIILAKDFLVKGGDLLIAMTGATIGKFTIVPSVKEQLLVNQRVGKFFLGDNPIRKLPFLYLLLRQESIIDEIINRGQGSAQPNISPSDIETIDIVLPNKQIIDVFNNKMQAIFCNLIRITAENQTLSELRDSLLPKLMNNELSLDELPL